MRRETRDRTSSIWNNSSDTSCKGFRWDPGHDRREDGHDDFIAFE